MKLSHLVTRSDRLPPDVRLKVETFRWFVAGLSWGFVLEGLWVFAKLYMVMWNSV